MSGLDLSYCHEVRDENDSAAADQLRASNANAAVAGTQTHNNPSSARGPNGFPLSMVPGRATNSNAAVIAPENAIAQQLQNLLSALQPSNSSGGNLDILRQLGVQELRDQQLQKFQSLNQLLSQSIPGNVIPQNPPQPQQQQSEPQTSKGEPKEDDSDNDKDIRVFPCKARGMPTDHNAKTAHLNIRKSTLHKEGLICSYPGCRDRGVKFCYCIHCGVPVARRNFKKRHDHGIVTTKAKRKLRARSAPPQTTPNVVETQSGVTNIGRASGPTKPDTKNAPVASFSSQIRHEIPSFQGALSNERLTENMDSKRVEESPIESSGNESSAIPELVSNRNQRPEGVSSSSSGVAHVKDVEKEEIKPRRHRSSSKDTGNEKKRKKTSHDKKKRKSRDKSRSRSTSRGTKKGNPMWRMLLEERPPLDDDKSMLNWLDRVVKVSKKTRKRSRSSKSHSKKRKSSSSAAVVAETGERHHRKKESKQTNAFRLTSSSSSSDGEMKDDYPKNPKPMQMLGLASLKRETTTTTSQASGKPSSSLEQNHV